MSVNSDKCTTINALLSRHFHPFWVDTSGGYTRSATSKKRHWCKLDVLTGTSSAVGVCKTTSGLIEGGEVSAGGKGTARADCARRGAHPFERLPNSVIKNFDLISHLVLSSYTLRHRSVYCRRYTDHRCFVCC